MTPGDEPQTDAGAPDEAEEQDPAIHNDVDTYHKMVKWLRGKSALAHGLINQFHEDLAKEQAAQEDAETDPNAPHRDSVGA